MPQQNSFKSRIPAFAVLLEKLAGNDPSMNEYSQRYLKYLLRHKIYFLHIYAAVLDKVAALATHRVEEMNLLDVGAGNGLLGMFAKFCGFRSVFLCDTAASFIEDSKITAAKLNIGIDGFIHGELEQFQQQVTSSPLHCVVGTDVIEHIYNLEDFFDRIQEINPRMLTVFTTASNPENLLKVKKLRRMQRHDELEGGDPSDFELAGEKAHPPFLQTRANIIRNLEPNLPTDIVYRLAELTRGKNQTDIEQSVKEFNSTGLWPEAPADKWNTCDPVTGSWSERILSLEAYRDIYKRNGFNLDISNGFYDTHSNSPKRFPNIFRNLLIKIMGKKIAPFITLAGFPN